MVDRRSAPLRYVATFSAATLLMTGCDASASRDGMGVVAPVAGIAHPASRRVQTATGLTRVAQPRDLGALNAKLEASYPDPLRRQGRSGAVLVDVSVSADGVVRDVEIVNRPPEWAGQRVRAVAVSTDPATGRRTEKELPRDYDNAFGPAARAALLETAFVPALKGDDPVESIVRMTVRFGTPSSHP